MCVMCEHGNVARRSVLASVGLGVGIVPQNTTANTNRNTSKTRYITIDVDPLPGESLAESITSSVDSTDNPELVRKIINEGNITGIHKPELKQKFYVEKEGYYYRIERTHSGTVIGPAITVTAKLASSESGKPIVSLRDKQKKAVMTAIGAERRRQRRGIGIEQEDILQRGSVHPKSLSEEFQQLHGSVIIDRKESYRISVDTKQAPLDNYVYNSSLVSNDRNAFSDQIKSEESVIQIEDSSLGEVISELFRNPPKRGDPDSIEDRIYKKLGVPEDAQSANIRAIVNNRGKVFSVSLEINPGC